MNKLIGKLFNIISNARIGILAFLVVMLLTACGDSEYREGDQENTALVFSIKLENEKGIPTKGVASRKLSKAKSINCSSSGISTIQASVYDANDQLLASGGPWGCDAGSGSITGNMAGTNRKVVIQASDGTTTIYWGEVSGVTITAGAITNIGSVSLSPGAPNPGNETPTPPASDSPDAPNSGDEAATPSITDSIIARFSYNNCDATDDSGNGYSASISGNAACVAGYTGKAFDFDGINDHMTLGKSINVNEMRSVSFWINSRGPDGINNNGMVLAKYSWGGRKSFLISSFGGTSNGVAVTLFSTVDNDRKVDSVASYYPDTTTLDADKYTIINNRELTTNQWEHVVVNITDQEIEIWINGEITNKVKRDYQTYFNSSEATYIGNAFNIGGDFVFNERLNGILDDLTVYNRPLTSAEIAGLSGSFATMYEGIEFPNGESSFADEMVNYSPGSYVVPP
ncbi:MAG TPA: LamG domain-containing protein, partial [Gammaproteobacteria bacterium]|nr:LamG domain-containing protein [Gammaproteobacteria bacterium]